MYRSKKVKSPSAMPGRLSSAEQARIARDVLGLVAERLAEERIEAETRGWAMLEAALRELGESRGRAGAAEALGIFVAAQRAEAGLPPVPGPRADELDSVAHRVWSLTFDYRQPQSFYDEKAAIWSELHRLARKAIWGSRRRKGRRS